jgi:hypothetical protein
VWPVGVLWEWMAPLKQSGQDIVCESGVWFVIEICDTVPRGMVELNDYPESLEV